MNVQRPVFAAALGAALLACTCTAPPRIDRPPLSFEIPAKWVAGEEVPAAPADTRPWWERFGDADTTRIVNLALAHNHDLRAAAARIEAAIAQARIAGADRWPQVAATFDAQRDRVRFVGFPFGGALTTTRYQTGLSLSWELDLWGRLEARERAALEEVAAAEADLAGAWLSLSAQAAKAWFTLVENERQLQLARATAESFRDSARRVQDRAETGLGSRLDERLALANVAAAEAEVTRWIEAHARAVRRLEVLLGSYPAGALTGAPQLPDLGPPVPAGLPADLVRRRPDVAAAERRVRAADAL
ncbi:MAG TPA: TolC family protein, partial [Planctomycetota bacterium]|nr:TolC family protein [Planctomycetota bacterium]